MEKIIESSPDVRSALVLGQDHFQTSLLLDPTCEDVSDSQEKINTLLGRVWPFIEQANRESPSHGRILKSLILLTNPRKSMCRTAKGTVNRHQTTDLNTDEIDGLYMAHRLDAMGDRLREPMEPPPTTLTRESLRSVVAYTLGIKHESITDDTNLFLLGMDSLLVLELVRSLNFTVGEVLIDPGIVYTNPTVASLWKYIDAADKGNITPPAGNRAR